MSYIESCYGCRNDLGNQQAHMNMGGCLYLPSSSESGYDQNSDDGSDDNLSIEN